MMKVKKIEEPQTPQPVCSIPTVRLVFNNKQRRVEVCTDSDIILKIDGRHFGRIEKSNWYTCVPFPHDQMKIPDLMPNSECVLTVLDEIDTYDINREEEFHIVEREE